MGSGLESHSTPNFYPSRRFFRIFLVAFLAFVFIFFFTIIAVLTVFDSQHNHIVHDYVALRDDVVILSTTFYPTSRSFSPNTAVILFNAVQVFHLKHGHFNAIAETLDGKKPVKFRIRPVIGQLPFYCKWAPFIAVGELPPNFVSVVLANSQDEPGLQLPLREPYWNRHDVVTCFTPLFLNERWQLLLATLEIYSHYGAFMHFYVRSMIADLFTLLRTYRNARVTPWPALRLGAERASRPSFDPNMELEFRNQAAAMTDCLLLYKESATFIVFPDIDDIIIPHMGGTYFEEFSNVFDMFPTAGAIIYNTSQASIATTNSPNLYSPLPLLTSLKFKGETRWGKLVVRPERTDSVWIHESYGLKESFEHRSLPVEFNSILHFRHWRFSEHNIVNTSRVPDYDPRKGNRTHWKTFRMTDGWRIEQNFRSRLADKTFFEAFSQLPKVSLYYPLIENCYNRIFYNNEQHSTCKGPEYCEIPLFPGLRCTNVAAAYSTYTGYRNLFVSRLVSTDFQEGNDGCTL